MGGKKGKDNTNKQLNVHSRVYQGPFRTLWTHININMGVISICVNTNILSPSQKKTMGA